MSLNNLWKYQNECACFGHKLQLGLKIKVSLHLAVCLCNQLRKFLIVHSLFLFHCNCEDLDQADND